MDEDILGLLDRIYDAVLDDDVLATLPARMAGFVGARSGVIQQHDPDGRCTLLGFNHYAADFAAEYTEHFAASDPWVTAALAHVGAEAVSFERYISQAEYMASYGYNEFARKNRLDIIHGMGTLLPLSGESGSMVAFAVHRGLQQVAFGAEEERRLNLLLPHIRRVLEIRARLGDARRRADSAHALFAHLPTGVLHLATDARLLYANDAAETLLRAGDGLVAGRGGRVGAEHRDDAALFRQHVARAAGLPHGAALQVRRSSRARPLQVFVAPFRPGGVAGTGHVLALVHDPETTAPDLPAILGALFGFSAAEARVATALARGETVAEIAAAHGVKASTVTTQLKHALGKAGLRRQAELVRLVCNVPLGRVPDPG